METGILVPGRMWGPLARPSRRPSVKTGWLKNWGKTVLDVFETTILSRGILTDLKGV